MGDSGIWSGTYLASQSWRYYAEGEAEAKSNAIRLVKALSNTHRVTGTPGYIARYMGNMDFDIIYNEVKGGEYVYTVEEGEFAGKYWIGHTSQDQYLGWVLGMAVAYDLIDDPPTQYLISTTIQQLMTALMKQNWVILNSQGDISMEGGSKPLGYIKVAWALTAYHITGDPKFRSEVERLLGLWRRPVMDVINLVGCPAVKYLHYFNLNLFHTGFLTLLRLSGSYLSGETHSYLQQLFYKCHKAVLLSHNPWFNGIYMSVGGYKIVNRETDPHLAQLTQDLQQFPDTPHTEYYLGPRDSSLYVLDAISKHTKWLTPAIDWIVAKFPFMKFLNGIRLQPMAQQAFIIPLQCSKSFLFQRNPYVVKACGTHNPSHFMSGTDFLAAYWFARYNNYLSQEQ